MYKTKLVFEKELGKLHNSFGTEEGRQAFDDESIPDRLHWIVVVICEILDTNCQKKSPWRTINKTHLIVAYIKKHRCNCNLSCQRRTLAGQNMGSLFSDMRGVLYIVFLIEQTVTSKNNRLKQDLKNYSHSHVRSYVDYDPRIKVVVFSYHPLSSDIFPTSFHFFNP